MQAMTAAWMELLLKGPQVLPFYDSRRGMAAPILGPFHNELAPITPVGVEGAPVTLIGVDGAPPPSSSAP